MTFIFQLDHSLTVEIEARSVREAVAKLRETHLFKVFTYVGRGAKRG